MEFGFRGGGEMRACHGIMFETGIFFLASGKNISPKKAAISAFLGHEKVMER